MTIQKFASDTSLHGVKHIFVGDTVQIKRRQLFWGVLFLALFGACVALLGITINNYFQYGSVTSATHEITDSIDFPSVTFCNLQQFKRNVSLQIVTQYQILKANLSSELYTNETVRNFYESSLKKISTDEYYQMTSYTVEETAVYCSVGSKPIVSCASYLNTFSTEFGQCFTFNSWEHIKKNGHMNTTKAGPGYGLVITLDAKKDLLRPFTSSTGSGFLALIHDPNVYPLMSERSFLVGLGMETYITIQKHVFEKLSKPYSPTECYSSGHQIPNHDRDSGPYSQEFCLYKCLMDKTFNETCTMLKNDKSKPPCSVYHAVEYGVNNFNKHNELLKGCNCSPNCHYKRYHHSTSNIAFTNDNLAINVNILNWSTKNITYIRENYAHIKVFYDSLEYSKTVQTPTTTFDTVLSDIGGILGIFLGASIMTLAEVIESVVLHILESFKKKFSQKQNLVFDIKGFQQTKR